MTDRRLGEDSHFTMSDESYRLVSRRRAQVVTGLIKHWTDVEQKYTKRSYNWKPREVMMTILSLLVAPEVVVTTISGATSNDKFGIMTTLNFSVQWKQISYRIWVPQYSV